MVSSKKNDKIGLKKSRLGTQKLVAKPVKDLHLRHCAIVFPVSFLTPDKLQSVIDSHANISHWAWIIHDRDVYLEKDFQNKDKKLPKEAKVGDLKPPHYHIYLKFKDVRTARHIAQWFGIQTQSVEKIRGKLADVLAYLIHQKDSEKFQYPLSSVFANFDVGLAIKNDLGLPERLIEISQLIKAGIMTKKKYFDFISDLEHLKYHTEIKRLFQYHDDKLKDEFRRNMRCIYIYGGTGLGKTAFAKEIAEDNGYSYYVTSSSNDIFNSYSGEQCIIADDLRYHPKFLTFDDLLRILDPYTASDARSRYFNKFLTCKLFIITTSIPIEKFFLDWKGRLPKEDIDQFRRRCKTYIVMEKDCMNIYDWNDDLKQYIFYKKYRNYIYEKYQKLIKQKTMDESTKEALGSVFNKLEEIPENNKSRKKKKSSPKD